MIIKLENFQNIDYAEIKLENGVNIITGLNGAGKSCLMRAIDALIFNPRRVKKGSHKNTNGYIQNGKDYCKVTVLCENYPEIVWTCLKEGGTTYQIGEKEYSKSVGGLSLIDLLPNHPFSILGEECFNLSRQSSKALLFDRTSSGVFNLINSLYEIIDVKEETNNFKNYRNELNTELENQLNSLENINSEIARLQTLNTTIQVDKLKKAYKKYKESCSRFEITSKLHELKRRKEKLETIREEQIKEQIEDLKLLFNLKVIKELKTKSLVLKGMQLPEFNYTTYYKLRNINDLHKQRNTYKNLFDKNMIKYKELQKKIQGTICPTCHQVIKGDI